MIDRGLAKRLAGLAIIPPLAATDHRHHLDRDGNDPLIKSLPRAERRKLAKEARWLADEYRKVLIRIQSSGAGYPIDQLLHRMAVEYTHRY